MTFISVKEKDVERRLSSNIDRYFIKRDGPNKPITIHYFAKERGLNPPIYRLNQDPIQPINRSIVKSADSLNSLSLFPMLKNPFKRKINDKTNQSIIILNH